MSIVFRFLFVLCLIVHISCSSPKKEGSTGDTEKRSPTQAESACTDVVSNIFGVAESIFGTTEKDVVISERLEAAMVELFGYVPSFSVNIVSDFNPVINGSPIIPDGLCVALGSAVQCKHPDAFMETIYTDSTKNKTGVTEDESAPEWFTLAAESIILHEVVHAVQFKSKDRIRDFCMYDALTGLDRYDYNLSQVTDLVSASPETSAAIVQDWFLCQHLGYSTPRNLEEVSCEAIESLVVNSSGF